MQGPLSGVRIVDLSAHISGPFGTAILAEQGADVIKIEPVGEGDGLRYLRPTRRGVSAAFAAINRNKRSIALDIRHPAGRKVLVDLIRGADVLVQNFRPGVIDRLGFSPDEVRAINPSTIFVSINGFGADGPYAQRRAYDGIMQASVGLAAIQSDPASGEPQLVRTGICDKLTAFAVAQAVGAALFARERSTDKVGQHVEIPMMDVAIWWLWPDAFANHAFLGDDAPEPSELAEHFKLRRTKDGELMVVMSSQREFAAVCDALGRPDIAVDPRFSTPEARFLHLREGNEVLAPLFASYETEAVYEKLLAADVPVARANGHHEVIDDAQVRARRVIEEEEHPVAGRLRRVRHPIRYGTTKPGSVTPAPALGEHSREILEQLGYAGSRIEELAASGVVDFADQTAAG